MSSKRGNLFVISAASGSGKSTLVDKVLERIENAERAITCTTRGPRGAERDGIDYHFLTVEEFERRISDGDFLEYARVHGDRLYGTARSTVEPVLHRGVDLFLVIDVQGAASVRAAMPDIVSIFIFPPSFEELESRLRARCLAEGKEDEEDLRNRLATARQEVARYSEFDYVMINDDLDRAVRTLESIVLAHRSRVPQQRERIDAILKSFGLESIHA